MSLLEFATELVNEAKLSTEAEETIFKLEQLKEVVFHREKGLISNVFSGVMELMTRSSTKIKRFLIKFASDALPLAPKIVPEYITLLGFLIDDQNDSIRKAAILQLSRVYDKVAMDVVNIKDSNSAEIWNTLKSIVDKVEDVLTSNEAMSLECLRLIEAAICFGFPSMNKAASKGSAQQDGLTMYSTGDIPIHHPHINRQNIEKDSEATFAKLLMWLTRGVASVGNTQAFSPAFMFALATTVAKVTIERSTSSRLLSTSKALTIYLGTLNKLNGLNDEGNLDLIGRENISRSIKRILAITSELGLAWNETDQTHYNKLRNALELFDTETESKRTVAVVSDPRKRGRAAAVASKPAAAVIVSTSTTSADNEDTEVSAQLRESAIEAVNLMEMKLKTKSALHSAHNTSGIAVTSNKSNNVATTLSIDNQECVEFGYDVLSTIHNTKSVINPQDLMLSKLLTIQNNAAQSEVVVKGSSTMINVVENQYQNIGAYNLENYVTQLSNVKAPVKSTSTTGDEAVDDEELRVRINYCSRLV